jgi:hypothetical protein
VPAAQAFLGTAPKTRLPSDPNFASTGPGFMFYATPEQRANSAMYLNTLATNAGFYANNGLKLPTIEQIVEGASRDSQGRQLLRERTISAAFVAGALVLSPAKEMIGLGYAKRELEDAHSSPSEKLLLRLLFLLFTQHAPTTPLFLQHREDINELLREPGLTALIGPLDDEEREEVRSDLKRLGFAV